MNITRRLALLLIVCLLGVTSAGVGLAADGNSQADVVYGADANPTGQPLGGGEGYSNLVLSGDYTVATKAQFLAALNTAKPGEVIYIEPQAEIDLTGYISLEIPGGVTIAGNRGYEGSPGPLIYSNQLNTYPYLLTIRQMGVRITGIRLRGPSPDVPQSNGLNISAVEVEVDNCEIYNWSNSGIQVMHGDAYIHHNNIHNVRRPGLGYPVVCNMGTALIEANIFDYYRHAIAGSGLPGTGYEARYNFVGANAISHAFDMHGGSDNCPKPNVSCITEQDWIMAGDYVNIHHNTFLIRNFEAVVIRGVPTQSVEIHHNWFASYPQQSVRYKFYQGGNVNVYDNVHGPKQGLMKVFMQPGPVTKVQ